MLVASCTAETAGQVQTRQGGKGLVVVVDMVDDSVVFEACLVVLLLQGKARREIAVYARHVTRRGTRIFRNLSRFSRCRPLLTSSE
jgi:hypothetical protein